MEINKDIIENVLEPVDFIFVYSDKTRQAFGMDPKEFEDAVEEYADNFSQVGISNNPMLFHMKATNIIARLNDFHQELANVTDMQKSSGGMGDVETKAIINRTKRVFIEGVNILAPYSALLLTATETENYA